MGAVSIAAGESPTDRRGSLTCAGVFWVQPEGPTAAVDTACGATAATPGDVAGDLGLLLGAAAVGVVATVARPRGLGLRWVSSCCILVPPKKRRALGD
jgi:hypothetical protein